MFPSYEFFEAAGILCSSNAAALLCCCCRYLCPLSQAAAAAEVHIKLGVSSPKRSC
jgi:hypothetical protein